MEQVMVYKPDGSQFDGKRTGRPKGVANRSCEELDMVWVYKNIHVNVMTIKKYPRESAKALLGWVQESTANKRMFMKRMMLGGLEVKAAKERDGEVVAQDEKDENLMVVLNELIEGYQRQAGRK